MTIISETLSTLFPSVGDVIAVLVLALVIGTIGVAYLAHLYDLEHESSRPEAPRPEQPKHVRTL